MDEAKLRAWWSHRQGLDGSLDGKSAAEVLERAGWARSVGGVGPYLTLFARAGISSLDGLVLLRRDLRSLIAAKDRETRVFIEKEYKAVGGLSDLADHAIFERGRLIGLWEFDPETGSVAWMCFDKKDKALTDAVALTERFVQSDLGDARSFSLDNPKSRAPRIQAIRKAGSQEAARA